MAQKMQLRNGKTTGPKVIKCCSQKVRKTVPYSESCVSYDTHESFSIDKLKGILEEFALRYETPFQRAHGLCEIYDYLNDQVESIRSLWDGVLLDTMRKQSFTLIRDVVHYITLYREEPELHEVFCKLIPKLVSFLEKSQ